MRRLFSNKAGATFNECLPDQTLCIRKDCIELICVCPTDGVCDTHAVHYQGGSGNQQEIHQYDDRYVQRAVSQSSFPCVEGWTG